MGGIVSGPGFWYPFSQWYFLVMQQGSHGSDWTLDEISAIKRQGGRRLPCVCGACSMVSARILASASPTYRQTTTRWRPPLPTTGVPLVLDRHARVLPLPAATLDSIEALLIQARRPYQQTWLLGVAGRSPPTKDRRILRPTWPAACMSRRAEVVLNAVPRPCQPGRRGSPHPDNLPVKPAFGPKFSLRIDTHQRMPAHCDAPGTALEYRPRSVNTMTFQSAGHHVWQCRSRVCHSGSQA